MSPSWGRATGPISLSGACIQEAVAAPELQLRVTRRAGLTYTLPALVHPDDVALLAATPSAPSVLMQLADGSDCVLLARADKDVPKGTIILDEVQAYNLHVVPGDAPTFKAYRPQPGQESNEELVEVELECRIFQDSTNASESTTRGSTTAPEVHQEGPSQQQWQSGREVCVEAAVLTQQLKRSLFGRYLARGEWIVVSAPAVTPHAEPVNGRNGPGHSRGGVSAPQTVDMAMRVASTDTLPVSEREDVIGYHCFRGRLGPNTAVYLQTEKQSSSPQADSGLGVAQLSLQDQQDGHFSTGARPALLLLNAARREARPPPTDVVHVTTSDGEWFPVKKKLLRPCIALTKYVRDGSADAPLVTVDVDTLTFDRVLLFLEAHHLGKQPPQWSLHLIDDLAKAADVLGLRSLTDYCQERRGRLTDGLRIWRYSEVVEANSKGSVLLILDRAVFDVTKWLPEHPGGSTIIPRQALNLDCASYFELYHASRESFLYLYDFYKGEVHPDDSIPQTSEPPSANFMAQLREYTTWRLPVAAPKAGDHLHLGVAARGAAKAAA